MDDAIGRYEILEDLGGGGMARVYKARDSSLLRLVAIKTVPAGQDPSFLQRLAREARTIALLSHPNIVTVYEVNNSGDMAYIAMEFVSGHTLERRMRTVDAAQWEQFLPVLAPCAGALDYAHRLGIIHCDIKPSNIMIRDDATPKILDFGIAKIMAREETSITQAGSFTGTPLYMAPEQISGGIIGPQADQYALAVIAYTLLARRHPFEATETIRLLYQISGDPAPPPSRFNPSLSTDTDAVFLRALAKDPKERFDSCTELFVELEKSLRPPPRTSAPPMPIAPVESRPSAGAKDAAAPSIFRFLTSLYESLTRATPEPVPASPPAPPPTEEMHSVWVGSAPPELPAGSSGPAAEPESEGFTQIYKRSAQTMILRRKPEERVDAETIARAQARELIEMLERRDFESAVVLRGKWLPGIEGAGGELVAFSEAARYLGAAQNAVSPHVRIEHLKRADKVLFSIGNQLLAEATPLSRHLPETLEQWKKYARGLLAAAEQKASQELPNPFRAGQPLRPDQGRPVFRGRDGLVARIEAILADADQSSSLALLGPRRCGKTSLLQMLPDMLPDCACVFFDLQDNPVSSVAEFFEALVRRAREQIRAQRRLELPRLPGGGTFEAATQWLNQLDEMTEVNRFLISIDEFERLEDLFPGDRSDLLRLMGLFRATIQHRRKVRLLVSGVAPFEELGSLWNDHFINVRELRIGHLDRSTSVALLSKPITDFPENAIRAAVASHIFDRTAGQPYLLQLYGALLINRLNDRSQTEATVEDIAGVEEDALAEGRYYFSNTYHDSPAEAREAMEQLAQGDSPRLTQPVRRWLEGRWLIDEKNTLRTPVLGAFIRAELGI